MSASANLAIKFAGEDAGAGKAADEVAGKIDKVAHSAEGAKSHLGKVGDAARESGAKAEEGGEHFAKLKENLSEVAKIAGGMVAGGVLLGLTKGVGEQFTEVISGTQAYGEQLRMLTMQSGATTEQAAGLLLAFKDQGINSDMAAKSMTRFAKNLQGVSDAMAHSAKGGGGTMGKMFKDLGINALDASGKARPLMDVLGDVSDKFKEMPDGTEKTARAVQMFGRAGAEMLPVLNLGREGLTETEAAAKKYGLALTGENVAAIHKFALAHKDMDAAVEGARVQIGMRIMPIIGALSGVLNEAIPKVTGFIEGLHLGEKIGPAFTALGSAFDAIRKALTPLGTAFGPVVEGMKALMGGDIGGSGDKFKSAFDGIVKAIGDLVPKIQAKIVEWANAFIDWIQPMIPKLIAKLSDLLPKLFQWMIDSRVALVSKLGEWVQAFLEWVEKVAPPLIAQLGQLLSHILAWVQSEIPILAQQIASWIPPLVEWVQKVIPPLLQRLGELFTSILAWLTAQAPPLLQKLLAEWLPAFLIFVVKTIPPLLLKLGELLIAIGEWIVTTAVPAIVKFAIEMGKAIITGLVQGLATLGAELGKAILDAFKSINLDFGIFHIHGGALQIDTPGGEIKIGARAAGGPVAGGAPYVVGEQGPELFVPGSGGSIIPNHALGGGSPVIVNVTVQGSVQTADDLAQTVRNSLLKLQRNTTGLGFI